MRERYLLIYKLRGILMVPPVAFMVLVCSHETEWDGLVWPLGLALFLGGIAMRIWAQMHLHYRLRVRKKLTTTGPYSVVRNPIYIANTSILLGLTVLSELIWFVPVMLLWSMTVYGLVVRREEAHLLEKYGTLYEEYRRAVPRWVPRGPRHSPAGADVRRFLAPSVATELHCLLWVLPFIGKELVSSLN